MKTILVTGAYGQLGIVCTEYLKKYFKIYSTGRSAKDERYQLDISNKQSARNALARFQPDIILNLAAMTDVDSCENEPKIAEKYNADGLKNLCDGFDGHIIQISTDYVFDGKNGPYAENDSTNPISVYGRTKLLAEEFLINSKLNYTIIRTNVLYGDDKNTKASFLKWVINSLENLRSIRVVKDQWNNPTSTHSLASFILNIASSNTYGLYHYADQGLMSRFEFAQLIAKIFELDQSLIQPILSSELNQLAPRPMLSGLKTQKIEEQLGIKPPSVETCLEEFRKMLNP